MAISFVGKNENTGAASGAAATAVDVLEPASSATGDYMIAAVFHQTNSAPPAQTGWTSIALLNGTGLSVGIYGRFKDGTESWPWSFTGFTSARLSSLTVAYSGVDTTTPLDGIAVTSTAGTTAIAFPAITPATAGAWIAGVIAVVQASTTTYTLSATNADATRTTVLTSGTSTTADAGGALIDEVWTSGAFTFTASSTSTTSRTRGVRFALRPASGLTGDAAVSETATVTSAGGVGKVAGVALALAGTILAAGAVGTGGGLSTDATLAATDAITATGAVGVATDATLAATDALTAAGGVGKVAGSTVAETGTITTAGTVGKATGSTVAETGTISAAGQVGKLSISSIAATGTVTTAGAVTSGLTASATVAETAALTAAGTVGKQSGASIASTSTVTAAGTTARFSSAALAGTATITTAGQVRMATGADLAATATIAAAGVSSGAVPPDVNPVDLTILDDGHTVTVVALISTATSRPATHATARALGSSATVRPS